ncbi:(d)CMP kinase [Halanaerobium hydrogeniformans]|uniref:Cytidylate kinase n=1 Tax=Halanaerobium hydrogeniformans TaxID=656519 RepID=E4RLQ7_HALHG|nr:(d)CMP kinase [Halanaerobium hydrogeniformans]ADQ14971.1 cytidylate kinase [Halanaerobium hydrogeniformans]
MDNVIAIDGPGGAGKSTIARRLAEELGYIHLDTGAMYRAVTYAALQEGIDLNNKEALVKLTKSIEINFNKDGEIFLNSKNVSKEIRSSQVNKNVSKTAAVKGVREILVKKHQELAAKNKVVMDGRDITTVVLKEAEHKFYLTASIEERARRRFEEMKEKNKEANYEEIKENIARRDKLDSQREHSPLKIADDAVVIDSTELSIEEVVSKIKAIIEGA